MRSARLCVLLGLLAVGFAAPARAARVETPGAGTGATSDGLLAIPALTGPVVDAAGALSPAARGRIEALAVEVRQKTGAELAVLIVRSTAPEDAFSYGLRVAEAWKLGKRPGAEGPNFGGGDNGLLFVVALEDRRMHMLTGYGLEGVLPDGRVGEILDRYVVPAFRAGDVDRGVGDGLQAAAEAIAEAAGVTLTGEPLRRPAEPVGLDPRLLFLVALALVVVIALGRAQGPPTRGGRRRRYGPVFWGGGFGGWDRGGRGGGGGGGFGGGGAGRGW